MTGLACSVIGVGAIICLAWALMDALAGGLRAHEERDQ